jgi:hypothetical protein
VRAVFTDVGASAERRCAASIDLRVVVARAGGDELRRGRARRRARRFSGRGRPRAHARGLSLSIARGSIDRGGVRAAFVLCQRAASRLLEGRSDFPEPPALRPVRRTAVPVRRGSRAGAPLHEDRRAEVSLRRDTCRLLGGRPRRRGSRRSGSVLFSEPSRCGRLPRAPERASRHHRPLWSPLGNPRRFRHPRHREWRDGKRWECEP